MPSEVSDIKQFIEICRRKDASCTFPAIPTRAWEEGDWMGRRREETREMWMK
jgi:hypothetical protein